MSTTPDQHVLTVDTEVCVGAGICASIVPDTLTVIGGKARVLAAEVNPEDEDIQDTVQGCPAQALKILRIESGQ